MRKTIFVLCTVCAVVLFFAGCKKEETLGDKVGAATDQAGKNINKAVNDLSK